MISIKESFLNQFDSGLSPHVIEFGKRLMNANADVFLLMARKAVCLVDCLETIKLTSLGGTVVSDRVLDMDTSWLSGKRVAVVDDALISGTTIYHTVEKLKRAGAAEISTLTFCVSKDWWSKDLAVPEKPYLELTDQQTTSFCAAIVDAMSLVPRPYAVDFPMFVDLRIPAGDMEMLSTLSGWEVCDVSSSLQRDHNVFSLTFMPVRAVVKAFDKSLGWNLSEHCQLLKIRVYGRLRDTKRPSYWCRVLPIVALDPLPVSHVDALWESVVSSSEHADAKFCDSFTSSTSRLRLVQYVAAERLGKLWMKSLRPLLSSRISIRQDHKTLGYLFSPPAAGAVHQICDADSEFFGSVNRTIQHTDAPTLPVSKAKKFKGKSTWAMQARLTQPFLDFYWNKEIKARELALALGRNAFSNPEFKGIMNRLRTGYSLPELRSLLSNGLPDSDLSDGLPDSEIAKSVSLFIDLAVDRGIIVPVTAKIDGKVFRAYRHGEDVKFAESEARLCSLMLHEFSAACGRKKLPHLWVEKLLVLLLRVGIHKQFLTRWNGTLGENGSVGVRYALKGAVTQVNSKSLYDYNPEGALTSIFLEAGYLRKDTAGLYAVGDVPSAPTKEGAEFEAKIMGSLFGRLLAVEDRKSKPILNDEQLTLIATCLYPNDVAGAVAASIDIFVSTWRWKVGKHRQSLLSTRECLELIKNIRSSTAFESINSGAWKYRSFKEDQPWKIIETVARRISDPIHRATWENMWPSAGRQGEAALSEGLISLINQEGGWCIKANILVRMLMVSLRYTVDDADHHENKKPGWNLSSDMQKILEEVQEFSYLLARYGHADQTRFLRFVDLMHSKAKAHTLDAQRLRKYAVEELQKLVRQAQPILDLVDTIATPFGRPRQFIKFNHALHVDIRPFGRDRSSCFDKIGKIVEEHRIRAKKQGKRKAESVRLSAIPRGQGGFGEGCWVCATGLESRGWLIALAHSLVKELRDEAEIRVVLMLHLPDEEQLLLAENTSDYRGAYFWKRARVLLDEYLPEWHGTQVCLVTPPSKSDVKVAEDDLLRLTKDDIKFFSERRTVLIEQPIPLTFSLSQFTSSAGTSPQANSLQEGKKGIDVGIITVVTEEAQAVKAFLEGQSNYIKRRGKRSKMIFYEGEMPASGGKHRVACVQQIEQGNRSVITAYEVLRKEYAPALIVLLGIGGSINKDISLCDVAFADQVIYYDKRKITDAEIKRRGNSHKIPVWLVPFLNDFFVEHNEPAEFQASSLWPKSTFKLMRGPIGCGEAVVAYRDADERKWLLNYNDKTLLLETEAEGLAQALYEEQLSYDHTAEGYLIVRGISDHADFEKDDAYRRVAADNAVIALSTFLKTLPEINSLRSIQPSIS